MELNPNIRRTVAWLNERDWHTCDSGDGATQDYECDWPTAYVVIDGWCGPGFGSTPPNEYARDLLSDVERLLGKSLAGVSVELSYSLPSERMFLVLLGVDDARLFGAEVE
jgi:hypothetical protein